MSFTDAELSEIDYQLKCLSGFSDLKDKAREVVKAAATLHDLDVGQVLMQHDEETTPGVYLILSGHLWLQYPDEARVMMVSGCIFGQELMKLAAIKAKEEGRVTTVVAPFTVSAKTPLRVAQFTYQACHSAKPSLAAANNWTSESVDPIMRRRMKRPVATSSPEQPKKSAVSPAPAAPAHRTKGPSKSGGSDHSSTAEREKSGTATTAATSAPAAPAPLHASKRPQSNAIASAAAVAALTTTNTKRRPTTGRISQVIKRSPASSATPPATATTTTTTAAAAQMANTVQADTGRRSIVPERQRPLNRGRSSDNVSNPRGNGAAAKERSQRPTASKDTDSDVSSERKEESKEQEDTTSASPAAPEGAKYIETEQPVSSASAAPLAPVSKQAHGQVQRPTPVATEKSAATETTCRQKDVRPEKQQPSSPAALAKSTESTPSPERRHSPTTTKTAAVTTPQELSTEIPHRTKTPEHISATPTSKTPEKQKDSSIPNAPAPVANVEAAAERFSERRMDQGGSHDRKPSTASTVVQTQVQVTKMPSKAETTVSEKLPIGDCDQGVDNTMSSISDKVSNLAHATKTTGATRETTDSISTEPKLPLTAATQEKTVEVPVRRVADASGSPANKETIDTIEKNPLVARTRRAMEKAASMKDYVTAGKLQVELLRLLDLVKAMEEAAKKEDYVAAGKLQAELLDFERTVVINVERAQSESFVHDKSTNPNSQMESTVAPAEQNEDQAPISTIDAGAENDPIVIEEDIEKARTLSQPNEKQVEMNRAVNKVRSRVSKDNILLGTSSSSGDWNVPEKEKRSKLSTKEPSSKSQGEKDSSEDESHKHRKSSSHRKHRRNKSSLDDAKSKDDPKEPKQSSKHKSGSKKSRGKSRKERKDGAHEHKNLSDNESPNSDEKKNSTLRGKQSKTSKGKLSDVERESDKQQATQRKDDVSEMDHSDGSFDFVGESGLNASSRESERSENGSAASSVELGEDSRNRFVSSKTFFQKASNSFHSSDVGKKASGSRSSLHGSMNDSRGRNGLGDSKNNSQLGMSASLYQTMDNQNCEGSDGSLDLFGGRSDSNEMTGSGHQKTGVKTLARTSDHSSSAHDSGLDEESIDRIKKSRNYFQEAEKLKSNSSSKSLDLLGVSRGSRTKGDNVESDDDSETSFDLLGGAPVANVGNDQPKEDGEGSSSESIDLSGPTQSLKQKDEMDNSDHSFDLMAAARPTPAGDSSDQSLDLMGAGKSQSSEKPNDSSDASLDLMGTTSDKPSDQANDSSDQSLDLMGGAVAGSSHHPSDRSLDLGTKKSKSRDKPKARSEDKSRKEKKKKKKKALKGILKKDKGVTKEKSAAKEGPKKKQVRFCFEGRVKESDPDRLPRPPLNVRQVSLDISADFMPREYKKSQEEEMQITQALSNVFAFESMSTDNLKTLINAFEPEEAEAGEEIVSPDSEECDFYVVADGEVSVAREGEAVDILGSGETFGEENLFHRPARRVSISALRKTQLFKVDQATYRSVLQVETRAVEKRKKELVDKLPLFDSMPSEMRQKIATIMKPAVFAKGATISSGEGEHRRLYLIDKGVARTAGESPQTFSGGDALGEKGFRRGGAGVVEATAATNVAAYYIEVSMYEKAIGSLSERIMPDIQSPKFKEMRPIVLGFDGMRFSKKKALTIEETRAVISLMDDVIYEKDEVILESGTELPGCMFYLRRGCAESKTEPNSVSFVIPGTLFGGSFFKEALASKTNTAVSRSRIVATDRCSISVLRIEDFLSTRQEYLKKLNHTKYKGGDSDSDDSSDSSSSDSSTSTDMGPEGREYKLENLVKKTILGEGGFGQVWLVSDKTESAPKPYAFKIQSKHALVQAKHAESAVREKNIMASLSHPFVVKLLGSFQDKKFIYFLLNMMQGGELYTLMHPVDEDLSSNGMPEDQAKFYAFAIADALAFIHEKCIVYRDLKPENVLIDSNGYPVLVDFGLAKVLKDGEKTFTLLGTPGYLAPEVCINVGHSFAVDHWALGVLIYEMIAGDGPFFFFGIDQVELYRSIVQDPHDAPENAGPDAVDLVDFLLTKDPNGRLGSLSGGEADIMKHAWFKGLDIDKIRKRKMVAPWLPEIRDPFDTSNFEDWSELEDRTKEDFPDLRPEEAAIFDVF